MAKPNVYNLGSSPEIILAFTDTEDDPFIPVVTRLSIEEPTGTIVTVSGTDMDIIASGTLSFVYNPPVKGWYSYEGWGRDTSGREISKTSGFEIVDTIIS